MDIKDYQRTPTMTPREFIEINQDLLINTRQTKDYSELSEDEYYELTNNNREFFKENKYLIRRLMMAKYMDYALDPLNR